MDNSAGDNGPSGCLVKSNVVVEWNDTIERGAPKQGYKIAADREQDENHVDVENKG